MSLIVHIYENVTNDNFIDNLTIMTNVSMSQLTTSIRFHQVLTKGFIEKVFGSLDIIRI